MTNSDKVLVPKRQSLSCPNCGKESYQRLAQDGKSILLLGKGQRFDVEKAAILWNCKNCGAEHAISLFKQESPIKKSYNPHVSTTNAPEK